MMKIRRNDVVVVRSGRMRGGGRTGKVLTVIRGKGRAIVEGMNLIKRHMRKTQDNPKGGIVEKEASLALSTLMLYCPQCKKGVRIGWVKDGDRKVRQCRRCKHAFDA